MYAKLRNLFIWIASVLCIVCLFLSWLFSPYSQAKYVFESDGNPVEIPVTNAIEINSVGEFVIAIENGYSSIKIADGVANPLLFMGDELDLTADLVLDLNGHELQRTGSDAMISVGEGLTLIIYDSADPNNSLASLYNPVGSVIEVKGGTLSLVGGKVESGVRANEFSDYTTENTHGTAGDTLTVESETILHTKYVKGTDGTVTVSTDYKTVENATLPKISAAKITSGSYTLQEGNIYVPAGKTLSSSSPYTFETNNPLGANGGDYYLYYMNESNTYTAISAGAADFYYEYTENGEKITVCGFYKDFTTADKADTIYAAILMESGSLNVYGGEYYQYFGVDNNYCVYATGGKMTIDDGAFVSQGYSTCLGCNFSSTDAKGTLTVKGGSFTSYLGDAIRVSGVAETEKAADDMTVTGGSFTKIADQTITVWGTDDNGDTGFQNVTPSIYYDANGSAINMVSGKLTVEGTDEKSQDDLIKFTLYGGGVNGIKCGAGAFVDCTNTEFLFNCDYEGKEKNSAGESTLESKFTHNIGILNYAGTVTAENNLYRLNTAYNVGIYSTADELFSSDYNSSDTTSGTVTITSSMFSLTGEKSVGVLATRGTVTLGSEENLGDVGNDRYVMFYIDHVIDCMGVYVAGVNTSASIKDPERGKIDTSSSTGDAATVNSIAAQFYLGQTEYEKETTAPTYYTTAGSLIDENGNLTSQRLFNSCGIYMNSSGNGSVVNIGRTMIFSAGSYTAGIFVRSGEVKQEEINGKAYKFAALMGVTVDKYLAGGQYDTTNTATDHSATGLSGHYREKFGLKWYVAQYGADNYTAQQLFDVEQANAKGCYGINTLGGDVELYNCYLGIYSTWSSGIYSLGGKVYIYGYDKAGDGEVDSGLDCKVITFGATSTGDNATDTANADIKANTNLSSPYESWHGTYNQNRLITSCVVRMGNDTSTEENTGFVYVGAGQIYTDNYGFYIEGGDLTFGSDDTVEITNTAAETTITSYRAPAIVLSGGNVQVSADDTLTINDTLNNASVTNNGTTVTWQDFTAAGTIPTDGIYVSGGSFTSNGTLNITFTGLDNDMQTDTSTYAPLDNLIKSYAVDVKDGNVKIVNEAYITVSVGGGVLADGGSVTLGAQSANGAAVDNSKIKIETTGTEWYTYGIGGTYGNWAYYVRKTGGHAVCVLGGDITIYYGTYTAKLGNGIMVSAGTATVYEGIYYGSNASYGGTNADGSGLGGDYGLILYNGGKFTSYGGIFAGANGGAFVHGTSGNSVEANIYAGAFVKTYESEQNANGFSIGAYAKVTFGGANGVADSAITGHILVAGYQCGIAVENSGALGTRTNNGTDASLYIYAGIYDGSSNASGSNAIWNGNSNASITLSNCSLYSSGYVFASTNNVSLASGQSMCYLSNNGNIQTNGLVNRSGRTIVSSSTPSTDDFNWKLYTAYSLEKGFYYEIEPYTQSTGNFTVNGTEKSYTTYTRADGALTYYFDNVFWHTAYTKIASGNDNNDANYNTAATVIVYANEALTFSTNWGMYNDGSTNRNGYGTLTAKYYGKDGTLKSTTSGSSTYKDTSWTLSEGEYIVFEYTPPTTTTGVKLKFDLQNIAITLSEESSDTTDNNFDANYY